MRYTERQVDSELLDQPRFSGTPKKIFICSTPRSGSSMLCRYMINAGLGVPHEYFNPINIRQIAPRLGLGDDVAGLKWRHRSPWDRVPVSSAARGRRAEVEFLARYLEALVAIRCQTRVFAAKIHFDQYLKVLDNPVGHKLLDGGLFIHLYRDDLLAQAVSLHFANLTGQWDIDDTVATTPAANPNFFDVEAIDRAIDGLTEDDCGWRAFLARNGVAPMSISYERLCQDPSRILQEIANRIGVDPGDVRWGYSEAGAVLETAPGLPSKRRVAAHFAAASRCLHDLEGTEPEPLIKGSQSLGTAE